jgi:hypothetical protein
MNRDPDEIKRVYRWTKQDMAQHLLPAIPLLVFHAGTVYLLAASSLYLAAVFLLLWIATNVAVVGICAGCPYRGGYCPGVSQLYFAPFLSAIVCKRPKQPAGIRSFRVPLALLGVFGIGSYLFAFYWLFTLYWPSRAIVVLALLGLLILHMPLSFLILCPKCSYNDTCPMAKVHKTVKKSHKRDDDGGEPA